ncbi:MAG: ABC transporter permease subunit [Opitutales bacterium]|nr:ABC transporter permease subunit [Opitutales bacterium]
MSHTSPEKNEAKPLPSRFQVGKSTLYFDNFMNYAIKIGGIGVIAAICGIFIFLTYQIMPLFRGATVEFEQSLDLGDLKISAMGIDPWSQLPLFVSPDGTLNFYDIVDRDKDYNRGLFQMDPGLPEGMEYPFTRYSNHEDSAIFGTADGRFAVVQVEFESTHPDYRGREVIPKITTTPLFRIGLENGEFEEIDYVDAGRSKLAVAIQRDEEGQRRIFAVTFSQNQPLIGDPVTVRDREFELSDLFEGEAQFLRLTGDSDFVIVGTDIGELHLLARERGGFTNRQTIQPFAGRESDTIRSMNFLSGRLSLILTNEAGEMMMYSIFHSEEDDHRILGRTKEFQPALPTGQGAAYFSHTPRNKAFLVGGPNYAQIRYATTEAIRWDGDLNFTVEHALLGRRYDRLLFVDTENHLQIFTVTDPHPETGWKAYFGKIHYEGRTEPEFMWQSDGDDDFEPKLSMVPLIWGTLKGTVFAMLIAVPIALLAAFYTSQFLKPEIRRLIKPVMEIMESVPTVVLGFLAALWLAPLISARIPSVFLIILSLPMAVIAFGAILANLPIQFRKFIKPGYEFLYFAPFMMLTAYFAWQMGPLFEALFFRVENPETGEVVGSFAVWWTETTDYPVRLRNAFVVGIFMGFAIIPTIFTIAEDSMTNVPQSFRSGALALGASRWQTAISVILPTAAAGIFSAIMIGFGRAVGETMILLMATGNTPIMTANPFDGMRTLAANIAVELPEAAQGGTLYRSLFLGALLLFAFTFFINTVAEVMRQKLRDRYKAVE